MEYAILTNENGYTIFMIDNYKIRFKAPYSLEYYSSILKGIDSVNSIDSYNNLVDLVYSVNLYCTLLDNGSIVIDEETGEITPGIVHKDGNEFAIGRSIMRMIKNLTMPRDYFSNLDEETTN